jgi:hypothetical protein
MTYEIAKHNRNYAAFVRIKFRRIDSYRSFHGFGQAKYPSGGLVLGLSQFSILPQLPPKIMLDSKVVKIDSKIIISLC